MSDNAQSNDHDFSEIPLTPPTTPSQGPSSDVHDLRTGPPAPVPVEHLYHTADMRIIGTPSPSSSNTIPGPSPALLAPVSRTPPPAYQGSTDISRQNESLMAEQEYTSIVIWDYELDSPARPGDAPNSRSDLWGVPESRYSHSRLNNHGRSCRDCLARSTMISFTFMWAVFVTAALKAMKFFSVFSAVMGKLRDRIILFGHRAS
jgi:hypothetical protein